MRLERPTERRRPEVLRWRREQLLRAGVPPLLALRLAKHPGYDLHALIELIEHGCPPELAARILAPVETDAA